MAYEKQTYDGVIIGAWIRGSIGGDTTFRVRRGNGHYDSVLGRLYQDKFTLVVPGSINNPESEPYRTQLRAGIDYWQNILSAAQKKDYNRRASHGLQMSGYNLFIREVLTGKVKMYVDRGDPAAYDFAKEDLTINGTWQELDLSPYVPAIARAVLIMGHVEGNAVNWRIRFRAYGNSNEINHGGMDTLRANVQRHRSSIVAIGSDRKIEYNADNQAWTTLNLSVRGWWT